jgi:hypothetical protein
MLKQKLFDLLTKLKNLLTVLGHGLKDRGEKECRDVELQALK